MRYLSPFPIENVPTDANFTNSLAEFYGAPISMDSLMNAKSITCRETGDAMQLRAERGSLPLIRCMVVLLVLMSISSFAQSGGLTVNDASNAATPPARLGSEMTQEEILRELQTMRAKIEQLEAALKRQSGDPKPASPVVTSATIVSAHAFSSSSEPATTAAPALPAKTEKPAKVEPFAFADWTWLNGNPRTKEPAFDSKFFTPEIRADVAYHYDFNHPKDDTIGGSSEVFRSNEINLTHLGIGGDFHYDNVRARVLTQLGLYSTTTPRNDASYSRGQWQLDNAYRYLNEAYGGYHINALHGINVDAGIFLSYVGLFSFYQFDNWAYQPSYVSSNTPWFFTGLRIQVFPTEKLKIEPWIINGWQSYARPNNRLGFGGQVLCRPTPWLSIISDNYGVGADAVGIPNRTRSTPTTASRSSTTIIPNGSSTKWPSVSPGMQDANRTAA